MLVILLPKKLNKLIGNSIGLSDVRFNFFANLSRKIMRQRRLDKSGTKRRDLVQLMMDAFVYENDLKDSSYDKLTIGDDVEELQNLEKSKAKSQKKSLTENEIISQCILFFAAGFETTASVISHCLYNLAINPDIQDRLNDDLAQSLGEFKPTSEEYYEIMLNQMPYLEAVLKETLRMSPPATRLQRRVGIDGYSISGIPLDKDIEVEMSIVAVHYCADYYAEPERFNPDRFMPENKNLLQPYTFLPFGAGPRNCIGMRFAYLEMKLCLAKLVRQFVFEPTKATKIPLDYVNVGILSPKNVPLRISRR